MSVEGEIDMDPAKRRNIITPSPAMTNEVMILNCNHERGFIAWSRLLEDQKSS